MNEPAFLRDQHSQALINPDARGALAYKARREKSARLEALEQHINSVVQDMAEVKIMIQRLLARD
jgi:hypothetical protein